MGMRIDEAGQYHAATKIEFFGTARLSKPLDLALRPDGRDPITLDENRAIADGAEVVERTAPARHWPAERENLAAAGNKKVGHGDWQDGNLYPIKNQKL